jgi:uncharacterized protein
MPIPLSKWYPQGSPYIMRIFNYIRNSIKIVVDAYNGTVTYYLADTKDPIAKLISGCIPGLIKPMQEMPEKFAQTGKISERPV